MELIRLKGAFRPRDASLAAADRRLRRRSGGRPHPLWGRISLCGEARDGILRVVTWEDGETTNAFLDRSYREDEQ